MSEACIRVPRRKLSRRGPRLRHGQSKVANPHDRWQAMALPFLGSKVRVAMVVKLSWCDPGAMEEGPPLVPSQLTNPTWRAAGGSRRKFLWTCRNRVLSASLSMSPACPEKGTVEGVTVFMSCSCVCLCSLVPRGYLSRHW